MDKIRFFIDFDGTITKTDVIDMILERFAGLEWKAVEKEWVEGRIGSRECLTRQIALVKATKEQFKNLVREVEVDSSFVPFLKKAKKASLPVAIVSDGLDWVIQEVLKNHLKKSAGLLSETPIYSNQLLWTPGGIEVAFPNGPLCAHACANCKERIIEAKRSPDEMVVFVGDGLSDRYAARASQLTFAKNKLLKFCEENQITHQRYSSFKDISKWLSSRKVSYVPV